jgi:ketosteroid isomerase-like protein
MDMTRDGMVDLMQRYFGRVDAHDLGGVLALLTADCVFRIETADLAHAGRDSGVRAMFARLFAAYPGIWHGNFDWVADEAAGSVACRLEVVNTGPDGTAHRKRNSSFYRLRDGRIAAAFIYMSGENALV